MNLLIRILSLLAPGKSLRHRFKWWLVNFFYGWSLRHKTGVKRTDVCVRGAVRVSRNVRFSYGVVLNSGFEVSGTGPVSVGCGCQFAPDVLIMTQNHDYNHGEKLPFGSRNIVKGVVIGDYVWVGQRAVLLPGCKIGNGAIVQAGAVVHGEVPPLAIVGGNPAVVFAERDKVHYEKLLQENENEK